MQFKAAAVVFTLLMGASALPAMPKAVRDIISFDFDPSVNLDLLNNLCVGIAVCNPVNVNSDNNSNNGASSTSSSTAGGKKILGIL